MATMTEGGIQGSGYTGTGQSIGTEPDSGFTAQGKEQVKRFTGVTRDRVYHQIDDRKDDFIKNLQGFASTLENASQDAGGFSQRLLDGAVGYVREFSDRIENGSTEELMRDAKRFIREKPAPFFAGCVALGFLTARILKD